MISFGWLLWPFCILCLCVSVANQLGWYFWTNVGKAYCSAYIVMNHFAYSISWRTFRAVIPSYMLLLEHCNRFCFVGFWMFICGKPRSCQLVSHSGCVQSAFFSLLLFGNKVESQGQTNENLKFTFLPTSRTTYCETSENTDWFWGCSLLPKLVSEEGLRVPHPLGSSVIPRVSYVCMD